MSLEIKECQNSLLNLLSLTNDICKKHAIPYWIDGGTLLGAARNNKFIPWDDDIDICLLPSDYKKLIHVLKSEVLPQNKHLMLFGDNRPDPHYSEYLADTRVVRNYIYPVKIDIIAVKSIPNNERAISRDKSLVSFVHFFKYFKFKDLSVVTNEDLNLFLFKNNRFFKRSFHINSLLSYSFNATEQNEDNLYSYIYNDMYVQKKRDYYTYSSIFPLSTIEFEGIEVMCPNDLTSYLTLLYGENYMTPPPVSEQRPAHTKYHKNKLPTLFIRKIMYLLYFLKNVKNAWKVNRAIKELKQELKN